jgi:Flp pilus assembly protein TadB
LTEKCAVKNVNAGSIDAIGLCNVEQELRQRNKTKQNKTKQNKTKQNKTKQNKTKRNETKRNETKRNETKRNETKQNKGAGITDIGVREGKLAGRKKYFVIFVKLC